MFCNAYYSLNSNFVTADCIEVKNEVESPSHELNLV